MDVSMNIGISNYQPYTGSNLTSSNVGSAEQVSSSAVEVSSVQASPVASATTLADSQAYMSSGLSGMIVSDTSFLSSDSGLDEGALESAVSSGKMQNVIQQYQYYMMNNAVDMGNNMVNVLFGGK